MSSLHDLRVIELCGGIPGPYCGKLFADAGASWNGDSIRDGLAVVADPGEIRSGQ